MNLPDVFAGEVYSPAAATQGFSALAMLPADRTTSPAFPVTVEPRMALNIALGLLALGDAAAAVQGLAPVVVPPRWGESIESVAPPRDWPEGDALHTPAQATARSVYATHGAVRLALDTYWPARGEPEIRELTPLGPSVGALGPIFVGTLVRVAALAAAAWAADAVAGRVVAWRIDVARTQAQLAQNLATLQLQAAAGQPLAVPPLVVALSDYEAASGWTPIVAGAIGAVAVGGALLLRRRQRARAARMGS